MSGIRIKWGGGRHPAALCSIPGIPKKIEKIIWEKIVDAAEVNQRRCCLEEWTAKA